MGERRRRWRRTPRPSVWEARAPLPIVVVVAWLAVVEGVRSLVAHERTPGGLSGVRAAAYALGALAVAAPGT